MIIFSDLFSKENKISQNELDFFNKNCKRSDVYGQWQGMMTFKHFAFGLSDVFYDICSVNVDQNGIIKFDEMHASQMSGKNIHPNFENTMNMDQWAVQTYT